MLDPTMQAIQTSLDGLAARQRIISQNLANSETPGYLSQNVNFEDSLRSAMASGDPGQRRDHHLDLDRPDHSQREQRQRRHADGRADRHRPALPARDAVDEQRVQHPARLAATGPLSEPEQRTDAARRRTWPMRPGAEGAESGEVMSIFPVFDTASSALSTNRVWMDAISDNLANVNTVRPVRPARVPGPLRRGAAAAVEPGRPGRRRRRGRRRFDPVRRLDRHRALRARQPAREQSGLVRSPDIDLGQNMTDLIIAQRAYQLNLSVVSAAQQSYQQAIQINGK